jgi:hypothetical protein
MDDLISRQAAIDALGERPDVWTESDYERGCANQWDYDVAAIKSVPSAQPDADMIHLQKEQSYMQGWEDARKAMIHTITGQPPEPHYPSWYAEQIKEVPSVQQKTGMWIALDECANEGIYCSICRKKVFKYDFSNTMKKWKSFKYCPNCGAKMEVEQYDAKTTCNKSV